MNRYPENPVCLIAPLADAASLRNGVTAADLATASAMPPHRQSEYLSWRALIYRTLGPVAIGYDDAGGPVLTDDRAIHIGVSHGGGSVAVTISDRPCAVDIEAQHRNFLRAASHFLHPSEAHLHDDPRTAGIIWCAKECLYKLVRSRSSIRFLEDLRIERISLHPAAIPPEVLFCTPPAGDPAASASRTPVETLTGEISARIAGDAPLTLQLMLHAGLIIVYRL